MPIDHLYWYALSFLLCGLYSQTHFNAWPDRGYGPHKGFRNKYRDDPQVKATAAAAKAAADADKLAEEVGEIVADLEAKKARAERRTRRARTKSRHRGESERERERRRRREREREESYERAARRAERKIERKTDRKRKREVSGEDVDGGDSRDERDEGARNPKRTGRVGLDEDAPLEEIQDQANYDGKQATEPEHEQDQVRITVDSHGQPQISISSQNDDVPQDALLLGGVSLPRPQPFVHTSDDDTHTPLPPSIRKELLNCTTNAADKKTKKPFSLLIAFCRNNDLLLTLISYLPIPSLISLYAISKTFHYLFNRHHTAFILSSMRTWAPDSDVIYPWRCYKSLCTNDPILRQKTKFRGLDEEEVLFRGGRRGKDLREVPTLRWLQMVIWRHGVCKDMLVMLATQGLRCPPGTLDAVKRTWFLLDLPLNAHRIALIQNPVYFSPTTLAALTHFILKLDMSFTHPDQAAHPPQWPGMPPTWANNIPTGIPLRKFLLAERNLTPLWRVLRGWTWDPRKPREPLTELEALKLWVRHKFRLPEDAPPEAKTMPCMGLPWHELGTAGMERTGVAFFTMSNGQKAPVTHPAIMSPEVAATHRGKQMLYPHRRVIHLPNATVKPREVLLRPDELLLKEGVRRQMGMHERWVRMMLWGFCDEVGFNWPVFTEEEYRRMDRGEADVDEVIAGRGRVERVVAAVEELE